MEDIWKTKNFSFNKSFSNDSFSKSKDKNNNDKKETVPTFGFNAFKGGLGGGIGGGKVLPDVGKQKPPTPQQIEHFKKNRETIIKPIMISHLKKNKDDVLHGSQSLYMLLPKSRKPNDWDIFSPVTKDAAQKIESKIDKKMKADIVHTECSALPEGGFFGGMGGGSKELCRVKSKHTDTETEVDIMDRPKDLSTIRAKGITHESLESQYQKLVRGLDKPMRMQKASEDKHNVEDFWKTKGITPPKSETPGFGSGGGFGSSGIDLGKGFGGLSTKKEMTSTFSWTSKPNWRDRDKDNVPDIFDCDPDNPKKQGIFHKDSDDEEEKDEEGKPKKRGISSGIAKDIIETARKKALKGYTPEEKSEEKIKEKAYYVAEKPSEEPKTKEDQDNAETLKKMGEKIKSSQDAVPTEEPTPEKKGLRETLKRWRTEKSLGKEAKEELKQAKEKLEKKVTESKPGKFVKGVLEKEHTQREKYQALKVEEAQKLLKMKLEEPQNIIVKIEDSKGNKQWRTVATGLALKDIKLEREALMKMYGVKSEDIIVTPKDPLKEIRRLSRQEAVKNLKWGEHVQKGLRVDTGAVQKAATFFGEGPQGKPRMAVGAWGSMRRPIPEKRPWMRQTPTWKQPVIGASEATIEEGIGPSPSQEEIAEMQRYQMMQQEAQGGLGYQEESKFGKGVIPYRPVGGGGPGGNVFVTVEPVKSIYQKRMAMGQPYQYPVSGPMNDPSGRYVPFKPTWVTTF